MIPIQPVNRDMLADQVRSAIQHVPSILEVFGFVIQCSATDINTDKDQQEAGYELMADASITVLNTDIKHLQITFDTRGKLDGEPIRIHSIVPSQDRRTTQFLIRRDLERQP